MRRSLVRIQYGPPTKVNKMNEGQFQLDLIKALVNIQKALSLIALKLERIEGILKTGM